MKKTRAQTAPRDPRVLIVSRTRSEAEVWARAEHLPQAAWTWAINSEHIRGMTPTRVIRVSGWWNHPDHRDIKKELVRIEYRINGGYDAIDRRSGLTTMETLFLILVFGSIVFVAIPKAAEYEACWDGPQADACVEFHAQYGPARTAR